MRLDQFVPLVVSLRGLDVEAGERGSLVESLHIGAVSIVDGRGVSVAQLGSGEVGVHLRSTAKPFQLLPLLLDGVHEAPLSGKASFGRRAKETYDVEAADLAVMMASHSGQPMHTGRVRRLLTFGGFETDALQCGPHAPVHGETHETLVKGDQSPGALHNNCSGKHTGMLLTCRHNGYPTANYLEPTHPLQQRIAAIIARLAGIDDPATIPRGTDGCSAPTFVVPLVGLARMFACLALPAGAPTLTGGVSPERALDTLREAAMAHPELVGGEERLDTALMEALPGRVLAKVGAQGAHGMAIMPCPRWPDGLGVAIKVADGDARGHVRAQIALSLLRQLGVLEDGARLDAHLAHVADTRVFNCRGRKVGELRPTFTLPPLP